MKVFWMRAILIVGMMTVGLGISGHAQWFLFNNPLIGQKVPEFSLPSLSGETKTLSELRGERSVIIFFWATWCPHCRTQLSLLNEKAEELEAQDIMVIVVDLGETPQQIQKYIRNFDISFEVLMDLYGDLADKFGVSGIPTYILVNSQGTVKGVEHELPSNYAEMLQ